MALVGETYPEQKNVFLPQKYLKARSVDHQTKKMVKNHPNANV